MWTLFTCNPLDIYYADMHIILNAYKLMENDEMKMYRHRIKLDDATKEDLTEKYGNTFEGQYLLLYCPYLEINIWDFPYYIEQFGQKEWRDMGEVTKSSNGGFRLDLERDTFQHINIEPLEEKLIHWMLEESAYGMGNDEIVTVEDAPRSENMPFVEARKYPTYTYKLSNIDRLLDANGNKIIIED